MKKVCWFIARVFILSLVVGNLVSCSNTRTTNNGGKQGGGGTANNISSIKYGYEGAYIFEFMSNGGFIWYVKDETGKHIELKKGTYVIQNDKINCTVNWVTSNSQFDGGQVGATFYFDIRSNTEIRMHIEGEVLLFQKISGGNLIDR